MLRCIGVVRLSVLSLPQLHSAKTSRMKEKAAQMLSFVRLQWRRLALYCNVSATLSAPRILGTYLDFGVRLQTEPLRDRP